MGITQRLKGDDGVNGRDVTWHGGSIGYVDRCRVLNQKGLVVWFTGLSGAGKSTIAVEVEKELSMKKKAVYRLDGDNLRYGLNSDLGFSDEDRRENIRRIAEVGALFKDAGIITLVACISPHKKTREFARQRIGKDSFIEVYVKADVEACIKRDTKGLYKKAMAGEIQNFTGISSPYEEPLNPELVIDTTGTSIAQSCKLVVDIINKYLEG